MNKTLLFPKLLLNISLGPISYSLEILPGRKKRMIFPVENIKMGREYPVKLNIVSGTLKRKFESRINFPVAIYLKRGENPWKVNVDTAITLNKPSNVCQIENWRAPEDLSCIVNMYWNEQNFYLYSEVRDDIFSQKWTGWQTFWGDCFQFAFGPFLKRTRRRFLFSFVVLDNDGIIQKRKWLFYGEDIATRKSMFNANVVTLVK